MMAHQQGRNDMTKQDQMMMTAVAAERRAKAVWADPTKSAQEKQAAVWEAVCARQQSDDMERAA